VLKVACGTVPSLPILGRAGALKHALLPEHQGVHTLDAEGGKPGRPDTIRLRQLSARLPAQAGAMKIGGTLTLL